MSRYARWLVRCLFGLSTALLLRGTAVAAQGPAATEPTTREMNLLGWQEFEAVVAGGVETVLVPTGTLEAHGVLPNGSDNLAPEAMARALAPRLSDVTFEVFGEDGGHAGNNETAYVQAVVPEHVHPERYDPEMATARTTGASAYPYTSSIVLYQEGQGYPTFDAEQARAYFDRVNERMGDMIEETIRLWDLARLFR